jgi:hypothetical protein
MENLASFTLNLGSSGWCFGTTVYQIHRLESELVVVNSSLVLIGYDKTSAVTITVLM